MTENGAPGFLEPPGVAGVALADELAAAAMHTVLSHVVPRLADWCVIDLDEAVSQLPIVVAHVDRSKEPLLRELRQRFSPFRHPSHPLFAWLETGRPVYLPDVPQALLEALVRDAALLALLQRLGVGAVLALPVRASGEVLGSLVAGTTAPGRRYSRGDVQVLEEFAQRAALAIRNARLYQRVRAAEREARGLSRAALAIAEAPDPSERFQRVLDAAQELLHASQAHLAVVNESSAEVEIVAVHGEVVSGFEVGAAVSGPPLGAVVAEDRPRRSGDLRRAALGAWRSWLGTTPRFLSWLGVPLRDERGAFGVLGAFSREPNAFGDEHERALQSLATLASLALREARLRERLVAERDRCSQTLEALPEAVVAVDREGRLLLANSAATRLIGERTPLAHGSGLDRDRLLGILRSSDSPHQASHLPLARSLLQGVVVRGEQLLLPGPTPHSTCTLVVSASPLRDASGQIDGAVAVLFDLSAIKEAEREKDEFLASVSHDLKNPLTVIRARTQLLREGIARGRLSADAAVLNGLAQIEAMTSKMATQIAELVDLARMQAGRRLELNRQPTDLVALARRAVATYQQLSARHPIRLEARQPSLVGEWDPGRLERVLDNLLSNAIKYSSPGREVLLSVGREETSEGAWAVLSVTDQGLGIPADDLAHIFERFRRGRNVGRLAGTGLGLAGAKQIVEQHRGTIAVESEEGRGTTISVWLPLAPFPAR